MKLGKKLKQSGVTFLEILAVLVILVLIYLAYSRSFGQGTDKAKLSDVQNSFKQYQIGLENSMDEASGLPSSNGINIDYSQLNKYLNPDFQITSPTNGSGSTHPTANPIQTSKLKDPWGNNYMIQAKYVSPQESLLIVRSAGKDKKITVTNDLFYNTQSGTDSDDVILLSDFKNGTVKTCTNGLSKNLGNMNITGAGTSLPTVDYDVPSSLRQPFESSYAHEYAIDSSIAYPYGDTYDIGYDTVRTYIYSNTPLSLSIVSQSNKYETSLGYPLNVQYIKETSNQTYAGFQQWNMDWNWDYSDTFNDGYSTDPPSFTNGTLNDFATDVGAQITTIRDISGQSQSPNTILGCN